MSAMQASKLVTSSDVQNIDNIITETALKLCFLLNHLYSWHPNPNSLSITIRMEDLDMDCEVDDDYSSTKPMNGKVTWMIDKGIWLGKKVVITGAVISSVPLVLPPLVVFSTLGLACSVPFGFVFATYACTQKIMSKLLPTPEASSVLEYNKDDMEVIDLVQGAGEEEEGYDLEGADLVQGVVEQEKDDLLQQVDEQGYVEEGDDLVQRAEEQGYEEDVEEQVDLEQAPEEQEMKDTPEEVKEGDILQENPMVTMGFGVMTTEQNGRNDVLPEGAALSREGVDLVQGVVEQKYDDLLQRVNEQGYEEDVEEEVDLGQAPEEQETKDTPAEVEEGDILQEKPKVTMGFGVMTIEQNGRNDILPEGAAVSQEGFDLVQGVVEQEYDDLLQRVDEQGYVEEGDDLVQRAEEQGYEEDVEEEVDLGQAPEEQEMKDTPAEVEGGDILQEKPIVTMGFGMMTIEQKGRNDVLPEGAALSQEDVLYGQDGTQIHNEEPVEQEKLMRDVVIETGMKIVLDDAVTTMDIHKQKPIVEEKQLEEMEGAATILELNVKDISEPERGHSYQARVYDGKNDFAGLKKESDEMKRDTPMKNDMDSMDIHKQKPIVEEKQLKEVEGAATILELNVKDISEPERGHSYQAHVYDGKNDFAVLKKESDEMKRDTPMKNDMDGEAKNEIQEESTLQANEILVRKSLEERPIKIIEHGHEGEYKEDTTKYIQVEDVLSAEGTEVRNEKPIIEDMNEKPVIGMRQVIVSVHGGKKIAGEQENEDIKECNKSQKLVLVAKKVTDETVGDIKSVVERTTVSDLDSGREDMNEKPVIGMRQVIVIVHGGKKIAGEQENEDIKECKKSQKLVLVAKKVTDETIGGIKSVVERTSAHDLNSAREIADECGLDLFDYTDGDHDAYNDSNMSQENDNIGSSKTGDVADLPFLRVSTKVAVSKHMNIQPETDPLAPSNEELLNEEKIWEQLDALRAILGYSAPMHPTSVEEIKALYIFTGVEPPPSLADNSDLVEMNEKLRLLKSVVGVK
ncbi:hypothetical protein POM88_000173 [Heracleum sosnowskyi]|uniref:Uncharacterized protein n=1 Tax=Heracleum sosnowskyi TaxID=360622 RepID=A0AAD8JAX8_9APIA|nr:hypothetical protein POM88_000173 [Heracleum sosnowskyi]